MKSKFAKLFVVIAIGALMLSSCELSASASRASSIEKGMVTISIPRVNPYIAESQPASKGVSSKAFAYVSSIELDFYQGEEIVKAEYLGGTSYDEATNTITGSVSVLAGTYDKLTVSVFNSAVSDSVPVVAGQTSGSFEVPVNGSVELNLILYPSDPVALLPDTYSESISINQYGEKWYLFYAPATNTKVTVKTDAGNLDAYIFGSDGKSLSGVTGPDAENSVIFETTPGEVYYVCLISPDGSSEGEVKYGSSNGTVSITFY